jgi:acyl-CoA synthetase (AMP-forming)/AMP-acid ligase II
MNLRFAGLADLIRVQRAHIPDRTAFVGPHRRWTYLQLDEESSRLAQALAAIGVRQGDPVACITKHGAHCTLLLLASSKLGAIMTVFNWRLAVPELSYAVEVIQPKFLMFDEFLRDTLAQVSMPSVERRVSTDEPGSHGTLSEFISSSPPGDPQQPTSIDDPVLRLFSSGTTGRPKAIEISHRALLTQCAGWTQLFGYRETQTCHLNTLPTFHVSGIVNALWMLFLGSRAVFQPQFEPDKYLAIIPTEQVTDLFVVPAMLRVLLGTPSLAATDLSTLRSIAYGGSPIDETLLEQSIAKFGCAFLQVYGMTEVSGTITLLSAQDHDPAGPKRHLLRSVGRPAPHIGLRVVHPVSGDQCDEGEVGELWVRTRQNMLRYYADAPATKAVFPLGRDTEGGWLRTGDAGYVKDGFVYLQDRIKDMIISGGENIYPAEVENVLAQHPGVQEVAVIGVPHDKWGETVKACVVCRPGDATTGNQLIEFARTQLAHYKCPTSVDFIEALPRNPSGKILKRLLREPYWQDRKLNPPT